MNSIPLECEAKFKILSKDFIKQRLSRAGATLVRPEFFQRRAIYNLPKGHEINAGRLRVRDEGDKVTMSLKVSGKNGIEEQKEVCLEINDFHQAELFFQSIGCEKKSIYRDEERKVAIKRGRNRY